MSLDDDMKGIGKLLPHAPEVVEAGGTSFLVVRGDHHLEPLQSHFDDMLERPRRIVQTIDFISATSLAVYLDRFATVDTIIQIKPSEMKVIATVDYHTAKSAKAGRRDHKAVFSARLDPRYAAWANAHGKMVSQRDFMEFLEDRAFDVTRPTPAEIIECVMNFSSVRMKRVNSRQSLTDGAMSLMIEDTEEKRADFHFFDKLDLLLPVFEGEGSQLVKVRLRYRNGDGAVLFGAIIHDRAMMERAAFDVAAKAIIDLAEKKSIPVYLS